MALVKKEAHDTDQGGLGHYGPVGDFKKIMSKPVADRMGYAKTLSTVRPPPK
jgi:hypothetical protein